MSYQFPLDSVEQASLEQVQRVLSGQGLYVAPTLQHVPLVYGPVYYYASAALARAIGLTYLPLRSVSVVASLVTLVLVGKLITREAGRISAGLLGAGLLAATYPITGIFDIGHIDALFILFLVAAIAVTRFSGGRVAGLAVGGGLIGCAALTKLPIGAAPVASALVLYLCATARLRALAFVAGCATLVGLAVLVLRAQAGPWATWYLFDLPGAHTINNHGDLLGRFWFADVLPPLTLPLLIGPVFLLCRAVDGDRRPLVFYGLVCASLLAVAWAARSNSGGALNVLAPGFVAIALLFGLGYAGISGLLAGTQARLTVLRTYFVGLCVLQFALLVYNPRLLVPYRSEQWAAERLSARLASLDGPLFAPNLDGYVRGTNKGEQPYIGAVLEIQGSYGGPGSAEGEAWQTDLLTALRNRQFKHVVLIEDCCGTREALEAAGYVSEGSLFPPGDDYWLWTNGRTPTQLELFTSP